MIVCAKEHSKKCFAACGEGGPQQLTRLPCTKSSEPLLHK